MKDGETILRTFRIALGIRAHRRQGRKKAISARPRAGTGSTARNPNSDYFLSIHVSYPNQRRHSGSSRIAAASSPGGAIMIHGQPNEPSRSGTLLPHAGLDERLRRGLQFGHDRHLADDAGQHAYRDTPLMRTGHSNPAMNTQRTGSVRRCRSLAGGQPRGPVAGRNRSAALERRGRAVPAATKRCVLAVLNSGSDTDDARDGAGALLRLRYVVSMQEDRGLKISA